VLMHIMKAYARSGVREDSFLDFYSALVDTQTNSAQIITNQNFHRTVQKTISLYEGSGAEWKSNVQE
jgi:hypothetical protein